MCGPILMCVCCVLIMSEVLHNTSIHCVVIQTLRYILYTGGKTECAMSIHTPVCVSDFSQ